MTVCVFIRKDKIILIKSIMVLLDPAQNRKE